MFKFKKKARYTIVVGDIVMIRNSGGDRDSYSSFRISNIRYSEDLRSDRVFGVFIDVTSEIFKEGEEIHLFRMEYLLEHVINGVIKICKNIQYEPKNL
jgi:hypothetical protein